MGQPSSEHCYSGTKPAHGAHVCESIATEKELCKELTEAKAKQETMEKGTPPNVKGGATPPNLNGGATPPNLKGMQWVKNTDLNTRGP